jgi:hypothetical protein
MTDEGVIWKARQRGYAGYFAAVPDFDTQRRRTAEAAQAWLDNAPKNCAKCEEGTAHDHTTSPLPAHKRNNNG